MFWKDVISLYAIISQKSLTAKTQLGISNYIRDSQKRVTAQASDTKACSILIPIKMTGEGVYKIQTHRV